MLRIDRIVKDYREAGSLNSMIALWGFVNDDTFLTKNGAVGVAYRLRGVDYECLDHVQRRDVTHSLEQALRQLDERFRVYEYLIKRLAHPIEPAAHSNPVVNEALARRAQHFASRADALYELELYLVVLYEGWNPRAVESARVSGLVDNLAATLKRHFSTSGTVSIMSAALDRAIVELHQKAQAFVVQLADSVRPVRLQKAEAFAFFRRLLNYNPLKAEHGVLKHDTHLDFFVSDSSVECHRDHLDVDDYAVKVMTMKEPPAKTFAHVLQDLYAVPGTLIACLEWQRLPNATMRRQIHSRRRHFFNKRVSLVNYISPDSRPEDMLVDDSASATVNELGQSLTEMEVHGRFFGACSITLVLFDRDTRRLEKVAAECIKTFAAHDGALVEERYNLLNAWLAVVPGNSAHNLRRLALLNTNCADLSLLFTLHTGERRSAHLGDQEYLAAFETQHQSPYFWNLHVGDVGHALVLGATGSGKSFLLNFIVTHAQKYTPTTVIFDIGGSYDKLTSRLGGSVWRIGLTHRAFTINPFCLPPTLDNLHFLFSFVRVLLRAGGEYQPTTDDDRELYEAVENVYALDPPQRRLITLTNLLPRPIAQRLHRWVQGGPYADLFDHVEDTLTFQRVQCFDFEGLDRYPALLEPLLFYILHRASASIGDEGSAGDLKLFVLDEAWRFAKDPIVRAYMTEALKTWRKRNAAMLLATQSSDDFAQADMLRTIVESCPTKFFLANPSMDRDNAQTLFHLNATEVALIANLRPRQQVLLKRPDVAKVLNLSVDPQSYWIYTNTPLDNERLKVAAAQHGVAHAADVLATG